MYTDVDQNLWIEFSNIYVWHFSLSSIFHCDVFLIYFTWSQCARSCVVEIIQSMKLRNRAQTRKTLCARREKESERERVTRVIVSIGLSVFIPSFCSLFRGVRVSCIRAFDNRKRTDVARRYTAQETSRWLGKRVARPFIYIRNCAPHIIAAVRDICVCMQMDLCSRARDLFRAPKRPCREICAAPLQSAFPSGTATTRQTRAFASINKFRETRADFRARNIVSIHAVSDINRDRIHWMWIAIVCILYVWLTNPLYMNITARCSLNKVDVVTWETEIEITRHSKIELSRFQLFRQNC